MCSGSGQHSPSKNHTLESWLGLCRCLLHVVRPEATVYLPLDVLFTLSPYAGKGHPLVRAMMKARPLGVPGPGSARWACAYTRARVRARVRARAQARIRGGRGPPVRRGAWGGQPPPRGGVREEVMAEVVQKEDL